MKFNYYRMNIFNRLIITCCFVFFIACDNGIDSEKYEGTLTIYADISQEKFLNQFIPIFENIHPKSKLKFEYLDAQRLMQLYFTDSISNMILSRDLTSTELIYANQHRKLVSKQYYFADDAIAIIGNKSNIDSIFDFKENKKTIVISKYNKDYLRFFTDSLLSRNIYALETPENVIDYISKNDAIGLVPFSIFSNDKSIKHQELRTKIKLLKYQRNDSVFPLAQAYISDFSYPLVTHTVLITPKHPEPFLKLFSLFLFKEGTSRAILRYGLVPARLPERKVQLKSESFVIEK